MSEASQQESRVFVLTNTSSAPCHLKGYPRTVLEDASGKPIPFRYHNGGDQMITSRPPILVTLAPGGVAYFMFNQTFCPMGSIDRALFVKVTPPGGEGVLRATLGRSSLFGICRTGDAGNLGSVVDISPIEPMVKDALSV